jgi:outer membrane lipopolysaccharide assembly protein LptE/RlpB
MKKQTNPLFPVLLLAAVLSLGACQYQRNNTIKQRDFRENSTWVYGPGKDSAAVQLNNKWPDNPKNDQRAQAIRDKFFGVVTPGE